MNREKETAINKAALNDFALMLAVIDRPPLAYNIFDKRTYNSAFHFLLSESITEPSHEAIADMLRRHSFNEDWIPGLLQLFEEYKVGGNL
ncbi:MAG: hypothetical protein ACRBF0_10895 [Calditrichia bacterium]